ncbi:aminotransferase-like domain-containing protein [Oryzibacter oryziterrae]|uniref:aminotransferase-like domain-containing protein n=1 Tax=Oryzibacter oryziterrae TaxID=2766474 RepID=UPI001F1DCED4|nr:PLP-dependent aminotransferase family protein [Oryzibacter oryziterrae]
MTDLARYRAIAATLQQSIVSGALRPGDRVISVRKLATREAVSLPTAMEALRQLEADGLIVARERSGFFVRSLDPVPPAASRPPSAPQPVTMAALARSIYGGFGGASIPLGAALPDPAWLPTVDLDRTLAATARRLGPQSQTYSPPPGRLDLRQQLARRAAGWGAHFNADEIAVTDGTTQALRLALRATCRAGDIVAVESPAYFGLLMLLESLGLRALEIPTDPETGLLPDALADAIERHRPAAVVASPSVQNPLGACMPAEARQALVTLCVRHRIPLIEDDAYGDLSGDGQRLPAAKALDPDGSVIYCGSPSKTLAPGWRIGWIAGGRYHQTILQLRLEESLAGMPVVEAALAAYLASGDYDRHLRRLKERIRLSLRAIANRVAERFPEGTRFSLPPVGYLLWIELPPTVDTLALHTRALAEGITVSPGVIFSPGNGYRHHIRLNAANEITPRLLRAIDRLGDLCREGGDTG